MDKKRVTQVKGKKEVIEFLQTCIHKNGTISITQVGDSGDVVTATGRVDFVNEDAKTVVILPGDHNVPFRFMKKSLIQVLGEYQNFMFELPVEVARPNFIVIDLPQEIALRALV